MQQYILLLFFVLVLQTTTKSQTVQVVQFNELETIIQQTAQPVVVVNFWATWCKPCVKELPVFNRLFDTISSESVKILMVSLDFKDDLEQRVIPLAKAKNIKGDVLLLDDTDYNSWINKIDTNWQGDIPYTIVYNKTKNTSYKHYGEITFEKLIELVQTDK